MTSIYQRILGSDFHRLHPQIQRRFGFCSDDGIAAVGTGVMEEIWRGPFYTLPFLYVGTWRRIMFPEYGTNVPFTIENYAYRDSFGRETVTWVRTFEIRKRRRFDATMIHSRSAAASWITWARTSISPSTLTYVWMTEAACACAPGNSGSTKARSHFDSPWPFRASQMSANGSMMRPASSASASMCGTRRQPLRIPRLVRCGMENMHC